MQGGQLQRLVWQMKLYVSRTPRSPVIQVYHAPLRFKAVPFSTIMGITHCYQIEFVPFCRATDTPMLLCTSRDGTLTLVRVHEKVTTISSKNASSLPSLFLSLRLNLSPASQHHRVDSHTWSSTSSDPQRVASTQQQQHRMVGAGIRAAVCPLSAIQDIPRVTMGAEDSNVYILNLSSERSFFLSLLRDKPDAFSPQLGPASLRSSTRSRATARPWPWCRLPLTKASWPAVTRRAR